MTEDGLEEGPEISEVAEDVYMVLCKGLEDWMKSNDPQKPVSTLDISMGITLFVARWKLTMEKVEALHN